MAKDPEFVYKYLGQVEAAAEAILVDKDEIIALDKRRNKNREALRSLKSLKSSNPAKKEPKAWMAMGTTFIKLSKSNIESLLNQDQTVLDEEINKLRDGLKPKVNALRDMENEPAIQGFNLQPLSKDEMQSLRQIVPNIV